MPGLNGCSTPKPHHVERKTNSLFLKLISLFSLGKFPVRLFRESSRKSILGDLDESKLPWRCGRRLRMLRSGGDVDVFGAGPPSKGMASQIVTILTAEEEEEEAPRAG